MHENRCEQDTAPGQLCREPVTLAAPGIRRSRRERGLAAEPGARRLELGAEANQRRLVAETSDELHRQRQPARTHIEWQHESGLAREVEPHRERREGEYP